MVIRSAPVTPGPPSKSVSRSRRERSGASAVGGRGLGPQVELGTVLLEPTPDNEATESDNSENKQLLHGGDPFTSTMKPSPGTFGSFDAPPGSPQPSNRCRAVRTPIVLSDRSSKFAGRV
nr:hypothetical protein GCM10010200_043030 [Actinomadura rugatobispora]